jgi:2,3-dihydroxy-2,3-dihydrophenylpropionate dehydrogenase
LGRLNGLVALITGAGSGIGKGVLDRFLEEGAKVGVLEINPNRIEELSKVSKSVVVTRGDVTRLEDNELAISNTISKFGKINILICNAGVFDAFTTLEEIQSGKLGASFDEIFSINVKAYLFGAKAAIPELLKNQGSIIFTSSHAAYDAGGGGILYTTSKFAVRGIITQLAWELAPKVRVNGVAPGGTITDLRSIRSLGRSEASSSFNRPDIADKLKKNNPMSMAALPEDHSWSYVYLASNEMSRAVTGQVIISDGGAVTARGLRKNNRSVS